MRPFRGPVAIALLAMMVSFAGSMAAAAVSAEWIVTQRMTLDGQSSIQCYDRNSSGTEGSAIRVRVRSTVTRGTTVGDCRIAAKGSDSVTLETEILVRCGDRRWARTVDARGNPLPDPAAEARWQAAQSGEYRSLVAHVCARPPRTPSSGTGFFVDGTGHVLTNDHVAGRCAQIAVVAAGQRRNAQIVARDTKLDLALLATGVPSTAFASFRTAAPPRAGEAVTLVGFPLRGLLAPEPIVSTGIVNAVAGLRGDATQIQISAPVQRGNSGGPLLDASGNVIGIVVAKLDAMKLAQETGDLPQNINFAIKGDVARTFLEKHRVTPRTGTWTRPIDTVGVAAIARAMTVAVECD
jgi:S1-C subfamily serine protease